MSQPHCYATMNTEMIDISAETYVSHNQMWRKQVVSSHGRGKNNGLGLQDIALNHYLCFSSEAWFFYTQFFFNQVLCPTFRCFWELNYDDLVHFLRLDSNQNISNKGEYGYSKFENMGTHQPLTNWINSQFYSLQDVPMHWFICIRV